MNQNQMRIDGDGQQISDEAEYPNAYAAIPPNGCTCRRTGLKHAHLYKLLTGHGVARAHVRVVNLKEPGASKGKTLFHIGDMLRFLDDLAKQQQVGTR